MNLSADIRSMAQRRNHGYKKYQWFHFVTFSLFASLIISCAENNQRFVQAKKDLNSKNYEKVISSLEGASSLTRDEEIILAQAYLGQIDLSLINIIDQTLKGVDEVQEAETLFPIPDCILNEIELSEVTQNREVKNCLLYRAFQMLPNYSEGESDKAKKLHRSYEIYHGLLTAEKIIESDIYFQVALVGTLKALSIIKQFSSDKDVLEYFKQNEQKSFDISKQKTTESRMIRYIRDFIRAMTMVGRAAPRSYKKIAALSQQYEENFTIGIGKNRLTLTQDLSETELRNFLVNSILDFESNAEFLDEKNLSGTINNGIEDFLRLDSVNLSNDDLSVVTSFARSQVRTGVTTLVSTILGESATANSVSIFNTVNPSAPIGKLKLAFNNSWNQAEVEHIYQWRSEFKGWINEFPTHEERISSLFNQLKEDPEKRYWFEILNKTFRDDNSPQIASLKKAIANSSDEIGGVLANTLDLYMLHLDDFERSTSDDTEYGAFIKEVSMTFSDIWMWWKEGRRSSREPSSTSQKKEAKDSARNDRQNYNTLPGSDLDQASKQDGHSRSPDSTTPQK